MPPYQSCGATSYGGVPSLPLIYPFHGGCTTGFLACFDNDVVLWLSAAGCPIMHSHPNTPGVLARLWYTSNSLPRMEGELSCRRAHSHGNLSIFFPKNSHFPLKLYGYCPIYHRYYLKNLLMIVIINIILTKTIEI